MKKSTDRRRFLKLSAAAGMGALFGAGSRADRKRRKRPVPGGYNSAAGLAAPPLERVRIGFVGVGLQGGSHVRNFLRIEGVDIVAVCDIDAPRAAEVAAWVEADGRPRPELYTAGETDYERLCDRDDVDLVFNATPWKWHVPVCVKAMESGKHTAVEVPAATSLDGCWQLVEVAEEQQRHCVMMENCNYGRREMMIYRMVREGLLGEILHAEGAYIHDLRAIKFSDKNEGLWRLEHSVHRNGNLYPTHGLGPVAQCLDVNRGDQFHTLVSMSSPARGLDLYAAQNLDPLDPRAQQRYALGDMNTSLIQTVKGRTIMLQHDTTSPRPYSRINLVQGTLGTATGYPDRVHVEGISQGHGWDELETYREFEHPLWTQEGERAKGAGHGGMDYLEDYRLIKCLRGGLPMDMDVYDAAALSAVCELSEISVAEGSRPVEFPDFTRGLWKIREPLGLVT